MKGLKHLFTIIIKKKLNIGVKVTLKIFKMIPKVCLFWKLNFKQINYWMNDWIKWMKISHTYGENISESMKATTIFLIFVWNLYVIRK